MQSLYLQEEKKKKKSSIFTENKKKEQIICLDLNISFMKVWLIWTACQPVISYFMPRG